MGIKAPPDKVFAALGTLEGLAGWWTRDTTGHAQPLGRIRFRFCNAAGTELGAFDMEVLTQDPDQAVRWRVKEGPAEWVGTDIEFLLAQQDEFTIVNFAHRHWREEAAFMAHCSMKWATFLLSLREWVETGRGRPSPDDLKIDNWN
ncbi:SRPBCC family protein [Roseateles amylovorans]|uniref:SRPBCC domain-containing protein n=1 Tax=Roseateles amylovorans TaxID=2978473 RepID=A0ABY6B6I7_9BURK|nr:SRPBCC domain-containing protein [Roseateles amylovorans]UXH79943.1 SRPBCC domain-containing protein [Roseateles amylovorans]